VAYAFGECTSHDMPLLIWLRLCGWQAADLLRRCEKNPKTGKTRGKCSPIEAYIVSGSPQKISNATWHSDILLGQRSREPVRPFRHTQRSPLASSEISEQHVDDLHVLIAGEMRQGEGFLLVLKAALSGVPTERTLAAQHQPGSQHARSLAHTTAFCSPVAMRTHLLADRAGAQLAVPALHLQHRQGRIRGGVQVHPGPQPGAVRAEGRSSR
jgi:hypothetical protein